MWLKLAVQSWAKGWSCTHSFIIVQVMVILGSFFQWFVQECFLKRLWVDLAGTAVYQPLIGFQEYD